MIGAQPSFQISMLRLAAPLLAAFALLAPAAAAAPGTWLAGDGHVHTCYSHDSWCPPDDDNTEFDTFYSSFATVSQRFAEAAAKDLDYLVISDHNDVRAWTDEGWGTNGVIGVHAYEHSLGGGHAHVLGAKRVHAGVRDAVALRDAARADGSMFQINHPTEKGDATLSECGQFVNPGDATDWQYGFDAQPDTLEVWNATTLIPPAELYWECWLQRGFRVPATGGSDSHGGNQLNLGLPTMWVHARERTEQAILDALRAGRTTITRFPPTLGGTRLLLEGDRDRDGRYEAMIGDTVRPGTPMRVRADGLAAPATVRVRGNGDTILERPLTPGGTIAFAAPSASRGWVRASLLGDQRSAAVDPNCRRGGPSPLDICTADLAHLAMTSPIYVDEAAPAKPKKAKKAKKAKKPKKPKTA